MTDNDRTEILNTKTERPTPRVIAVRRIFKAVEMDDEERSEVSHAVEVLYANYHDNADVPTLDALADMLEDAGLAEKVANIEPDPFKIRHAKAIVAGAAAVVIVAVIAGASIAANSGLTADASQKPAIENQSEDGGEEETAPKTVEFAIDAEGWNTDSSPFIAHVAGKTDDGDEVDFYHAVASDGSSDEIELEAGSYEVGWISAINADGSIYRTPEAPVEVVIDDAAETEDSGTAAVDIEESFEQVPADQVTQDDLDAVLEDIKDAVGSGDDTLTGEAGQTVVDTATGNAANNPNADKDAIEEAKEEAEGNVADTSTKPEAGTGGSQNTGNGKPENDSKPAAGSDKPAADTNSKPATGGGPSSSSESNPSGGSSKPAHTHNWVAQTSQQWVQDSAAWDEQVWVQDSAAWDETVQAGSYVQCSCGYSCGSTGEWDAHVQAQIAAGSYDHSYSVVPKYETIHHDATGHYETVHHDATGHYETVTTGYKCSGCGATK